MNEEYDVIVLGTGLKECVLSGLLAVAGKKILHLDRNSYYGAETASLNLTNLWAMFRSGVEPPKVYGHNRDWNIDLIPKFVMANGLLVKMLLHTKVTRYLEWKTCDASYVMQHQKAGIFSSAKQIISKVPSNDKEALKSNLMGLFEKKRCHKFVVYLDGIDENDKSTWGGFDLNVVPMADVYKKFSLEANTIDFIGHALAMELNDDYLSKPAMPTIQKITLYMQSQGKYGESPFLYPVYGLGGLPESFSRLCAIHGGTYMLNAKIDGIEWADNKVAGVKIDGQFAKAPLVICDPSYVKEAGKTKVTGRVIRAICILDHPIPNTNNAQSIQIILPQKQTNRKSDIYISMVSAAHNVCRAGLYLAICSATIETNDPQAELKPALDLLGECLDTFISISDLHEPTNDSKAEGLFVTSSYDATSHFETSGQDIIDMYEQIVGEKLVFNIQPGEEDEY